MKLAAIFGPHASANVAHRFRESINAEWTSDITADLDAALIFGGDGTIRRHLPRIHEYRIPVLTIPSGSGNDFPSALGIHNPKQALQVWQRFVRKRDNVGVTDLGTVRDSRGTSHIFCNVANLGLDADINRRANNLPPFLRANGGYILSLFPALFSYECPAVRLVADGHTIASPMTLAVAANGPRYGRGLRIAPRANMSDGLLDLCFVRELSKLKIASLFPLVYFGWHLGLREVQYLRFRKLQVETARPMDIYADGDYLCQTPAEIGVLPGALHVITPAPTR